MTQIIYTQNEIKEKLEPIFKEAPIERAVLFGSYAQGLQTPSSDVDIVIDSAGRIRGIDFFGVLEEITVCLDKRVDLIEKYEIQKNSPILRTIEQEGVVLYERKG
jgi:predicted nucleotidyltransferase